PRPAGDSPPEQRRVMVRGVQRWARRPSNLRACEQRSAHVHLRLLMTPDTIRAARIALGLTQTEVAHELGVDLRTYQRWEAGDAPLPRWLERKTATMIHRLHDAMEAQ